VGGEVGPIFHILHHTHTLSLLILLITSPHSPPTQAACHRAWCCGTNQDSNGPLEVYSLGRQPRLGMSPQEGEGGAPADTTTTTTTMETTPEATATPSAATAAAAIAASDPPSTSQEGGGQPSAPGSPTHAVHRGPHPHSPDQRNKKKKKKKKNAQAEQQDDGNDASSPPTTSTNPLNMTPSRSPRARSPLGPGSPTRTPKKHVLIPPNLDVSDTRLAKQLLAGGIMGSSSGAPSLPNTPSRSPSRRSRHARRAKSASTIKKRIVFYIFALGTIFGMSALWWYLHLSYPQYFPSLPPNVNLNISAVLPAGLGLGLGGGDLNSMILSDIYGYMSGASTPETYPGLDAKAKNYTAKYPIVLIPGFVTTGLEVWQGEECASSLFRSRLWGALSMLQV